MQLCAITDRVALGESGPPPASVALHGPACEEQRTSRLVELAAGWARGGVNYVQVREKDLDAAALEVLVRRIVAAVGAASAPDPGQRTTVLVNGPASVAAEAGADGVHLRGGYGQGAVAEARLRFSNRDAVVSVSCHSIADVEQAQDEGADFVLFAPVFGKVVTLRADPFADLRGVGLASLAAACRAAGGMPVFALGGVTAQNAAACLDAGAAGIAAIRLFIGEDWRLLR